MAPRPRYQKSLTKNFTRDRWLILTAMVLVVAMTVVYIFTLYRPTYSSVAKVWLKDVSSPSFVTDLETSSSFKSLTLASNPLLTQMEILQSNEMSRYFSHYVWKQYPQRYEDDKHLLNTSQYLKATSAPGTDIIRMEFEWDDPKAAQELLSVIVAKYQDMVLAINKKIRTERRIYIETRLKDIEQKLAKVRDDIKHYKLQTKSVDLNEESKYLVHQKSQFTSRYEEVLAKLKTNESKISEIEGQLNLDIQEALHAVAQGLGNRNLERLKDELNDAMQTYAYDNIKLAPTNPKMVALHTKIETIKAQLQKEIVATVGQQAADKVDSTVNIYDPVRERLVSELSLLQSDMMGLRAERDSLEKTLARIDSDIALMPSNQLTLENLMQDEKALSAAYDELRTKQIEARIKETEVDSNIVVIDKPSYPQKETFPTSAHLLLFAMVLGLMTGLGLSVAKTYLTDSCDDVEDVEHATQARVLGSLPPPQSDVAAQQRYYNDIVASLLMEGEKRGARAVAFASTTSLLQTPSVLVQHVAMQLDSFGYSVAVVDPQFELSEASPAHLKQSVHSLSLSKLILALQNKQNLETLSVEERLLPLLRKPEGVVPYLMDAGTADEASHVFSSKAFKDMVALLKTHYDWVLINTPFTATSNEFTPLTPIIDGTVLVINHQTTQTRVQQITRSLHHASAPLVGSIVEHRLDNPALAFRLH